MGRLTHNYIAEEATQTFASWSNKEVLAFHYFNPNGLYAQWNSMCGTINQWIDAGIIPSGWSLAYGSLSSYASDRLVELYTGNRPGSVEVRVVLQMLQEAINKGYVKLGEMIMEA